MFKPTLDQQQLIDSKESEINQLAAKMWSAVNEIDFDPMHPNWDFFEDPVKDHFIAAASYAYVSMYSDGVS